MCTHVCKFNCVKTDVVDVRVCILQDRVSRIPERLVKSLCSSLHVDAEDVRETLASMQNKATKSAQVLSGSTRALVEPVFIC